MIRLCFIAVVLLAAGCRSHPPIQLPGNQGNASGGAPAWTSERPIDSRYYFGIGKSQKNEDNYAEAAKKRALDDLASEIEVTISSSSIFSQMDDQKGYRENFETIIKTHAEEHLEGFEPLQSYSQGNDYWTGYRLSKEQYRADRDKKIQRLTSITLDNIKTAQRKSANGQADKALESYMESLVLLEDYLNEDLPAELDGQKIYLSYYLYSRIKEILSDLAFTQLSNDSSFTPFQDGGNKFSYCRLKLGEKAMSATTVSVYSTDYSSQVELTTDKNGVVKIPLLDGYLLRGRNELGFVVALNSTSFNARKSEIVDNLMRGMRPANFRITFPVQVNMTVLYTQFRQKMDQGLALIQSGDYTLAKAYFIQASEIKTDDFQSLIAVARLEEREGNYEKMIQALIRAVKRGASLHDILESSSTKFVELVHQPRFEKFIKESFGENAYSGEALVLYQQYLTKSDVPLARAGNTFHATLKEEESLFSDGKEKNYRKYRVLFSSIPAGFTPNFTNGTNQLFDWTYKESGFYEKAFPFAVNGRAAIGTGAMQYSIAMSDFSALGKVWRTVYRFTIKYPVGLILYIGLDLPFALITLGEWMPNAGSLMYNQRTMHNKNAYGALTYKVID